MQYKISSFLYLQNVKQILILFNCIVWVGKNKHAKRYNISYNRNDNKYAYASVSYYNLWFTMSPRYILNCLNRNKIELFTLPISGYIRKNKSPYPSGYKFWWKQVRKYTSSCIFIFYTSCSKCDVYFLV